MRPCPPPFTVRLTGGHTCSPMVAAAFSSTCFAAEAYAIICVETIREFSRPLRKWLKTPNHVFRRVYGTSGLWRTEERVRTRAFTLALERACPMWSSTNPGAQRRQDPVHFDGIAGAGVEAVHVARVA